MSELTQSRPDAGAFVPPLLSCRSCTTRRRRRYAIINAGGFLAVAKHDVTVPVSQLKLVDDKLVLPGATKEAFESAK